ncbi:haloacid dehalogenase [Microbacterium barkeri]|uniref:Haloacid dehalogenase n=1 Tax=Microbacterium barkeri TaxID=33917 RepID=A0A9W6H1H7_9MICO|nr:HAD hydrolase-like protein [Microbacterium barkeri]MDR6877595.1 phosphoglycolate phosphatase [Microbacterium barkeri]GLJ60750.1 haloacid dehalogenase [Microbacterium barkeri]
MASEISPWSCILWDVDGTVADASAGILPRITQVLTDLGRTPPGPDELSAWIGPPMLESFQVRGMLSPEEAVDAVARYRELAAREGYAESVALYPGVADLIHAVNAAGVPQATASTKPENQVIAILEHYGLAGCFTSITGASSDADSLDTKATVLAKALERLKEAGVDTSHPVLIGDRHHDVDGATEHDVPVIFVRWGFGTPGEEEGAIAVVDDIDQLRPLLLSEQSEQSDAA